MINNKCSTMRSVTKTATEIAHTLLYEPPRYMYFFSYAELMDEVV